MTSSAAEDDSHHQRRREFLTTHWSVVRAAGSTDTPARQAALSELCQDYWYPLYAFVRRRGHAAVEAQDLTQAFFSELLEKERLDAADQSRGRFRSFLLASMNNFLANHHRHVTAQRRGGDRRTLSLDFDRGESRYHLEPADTRTPEQIFQRQWAMQILEAALQQLSDEHRNDKRAQFELLKPVLIGGPDDGSQSYRNIAQQLEVSESVVKVAVHRLRKRYSELLRQQVAQTVASNEEIDDELRQLFNALGS